MNNILNCVKLQQHLLDTMKYYAKLSAFGLKGINVSFLIIEFKVKLRFICIKYKRNIYLFV